MRMSIVVPLLTLTLAAAPSRAHAQNAPAAVAGASPSQRVYEGPSLSLPEAVREALGRHPDLAALRAGEVVARTRPDTERFLMPPMLEAQVFQWPFDTIDPGDAQIMFTLGQELPGRGKRQARMAFAEQEAAVAAGQVEVRGVQLAAQVKLAYADLWLARESLAAYDASVELVRQLTEIAEAKYVTGRVSQQDILRAVVERVRLEEEIIASVGEARLAEARLNSLLQRAPESPIGPLVAPPGEIVLPAASALQARAVARHPEIALVARQTDAVDAAIAVADTERRPDYLLRGGVMLMPDMTNAWTATFSATWPGAPWSRKRTDALVREAAARREATLAERAAVETRVRLGVQEAHVRARAAIERAALLTSSVVPPAEHLVEVARVAYQTDRGDFVGLVDAERTLLSIRLDVQKAIAERERALAELELAIGEDIRWTAEGQTGVTWQPGGARDPGTGRGMLSALPGEDWSGASWQRVALPRR